MRAIVLVLLALAPGSALRFLPHASKLLPMLRSGGDPASRTTFEVKRLADVDWEEIGLVNSVRMPALENSGPARRVDLTPGAGAAAADLLRPKRRAKERKGDAAVVRRQM